MAKSVNERRLKCKRITVSRNVQVKLFSILVEIKEAIAHLIQKRTTEFELKACQARDICGFKQLVIIQIYAMRRFRC
ncbi:hypothetical protein [Pedobacter agri]|uniref:hypothetical protein n=1 Tax=Pedobacter agri TaxID=454586 RepID=UPI002781ED28|nr:hypothetical protein [Pedobacter agri]MDQ1139514.1 hypothetical protein [Pedobacter agri]